MVTSNRKNLSMELNNILEKVAPKVVEVGEFLYANWSSSLIEKTHLDGVDISTNLDRQASKFLTEFIATNYPNHTIQDEELSQHADTSTGYVWSIDPIDGTKYFATHFPLWSVCVALLKDGEPVLGIIYVPASKNLYTSFAGGGAYFNNHNWDAPPPKPKSKSIVSWDLPLNETQFNLIDDESFDQTWQQLETKHFQELQNLTKNCYRVRSLGNGSISLLGVASGLFQAYIAPLRPINTFYDVAAGIQVCHELGLDVEITQLSPKFHSIRVTNFF